MRKQGTWLPRLRHWTLLGGCLLFLGLPLEGRTSELRFHQVTGAGDVPLNVVEIGPTDAPAILLIHGFSQSYLAWLPQLRDQALNTRYRLVALDLRGHGGSGKPWAHEAYAGSTPWASDLRAVVSELGLERPVLVGWSFGGYVAMDYLREYGADEVTGIVLVGSHAGLLPRPAAAGPAPVGDLEALFADGRVFVERMSAEPLPAETVEHMRLTHAMMSPYVRAAMRGKRLDNQDLVAAGKLTRPVHAILGAEDASVPAAQFLEALAQAPCADGVVYENVGHSPFVERETRFNADLARFAERAAKGCPVSAP